jgi:single-strand DNA-binding protein
MPIPNINNVVLTGQLVRDPELRALPSGASVCNLRVAVNARRRNPAGEWGQEPNFFDVAVYGPHAETTAKYCHKGPSHRDRRAAGLARMGDP